ncbi:MAG: element excision factor XisI family protein [Saprospiraceae bacterium]
MAAKDKFHEVLKTALVKDGWTVTDDPYVLKIGGNNCIMATIKEKIKNYQQLLIGLLQDYAREHSGNPEMEDQILADTDRNHFQLIRLGWDKDDRIENILLHFDIKPDGKIWIQSNWTETRVAEELLRRGVSKSDIVLGMQPPTYRQYTEYAAA